MPYEEAGKHATSANVVIELTEEEYALAEKVGHKRSDEDFAAGHPRGGLFLAFDSSGYEQDTLGVCGEIAFARFLGIKYVPPAMKAMDVGDYEVRTASKDGYRLIVRSRDADHKKFVSVVRISRLEYKIQGWITAGEAKKVGELKNPAKGSNAGPAFFVPTMKLHPFGFIPKVESTFSRKTTKVAAGKDSLTPDEIALTTPLLKKRIPVDEGPGCFLCKWIHEDLGINGKLTGYPKSDFGDQFPAASKVAHMKLEGMLP